MIKEILLIFLALLLSTYAKPALITDAHDYSPGTINSLEKLESANQILKDNSSDVPLTNFNQDDLSEEVLTGAETAYNGWGHGGHHGGHHHGGGHHGGHHHGHGHGHHYG